MVMGNKALKQRKTILWFGSNTNRKNWYLAKNIFQRLLTDYDDFFVKAIIKSENNKIFVNLKEYFPNSFNMIDFIPKSEFEEILKGADMILSTSFREVNSTLILESLARGKPVFSSAFPGALDTIHQDYLFKWNDSPDHIVNQLINKIGKSELFTSSVVEQYINQKRKAISFLNCDYNDI